MNNLGITFDYQLRLTDIESSELQMNQKRDRTTTCFVLELQVNMLTTRRLNSSGRNLCENVSDYENRRIGS